MKLHILGIAGKFMSGLAVIAHQCGFDVSGSDLNLDSAAADILKNYPIALTLGYEAETLSQTVDLVIVGNALSRGRPVVERILNEQIPYCSGPEWLSRYVLQNRWVLAVSGTHGKTTTTSMVAWILDYVDLNPGFLIGGNPLNFDCSARYTDSPFFVIEADEYDTAFFDKRSKFLHYHPKTLIINNLEFDHADIFQDLNDIKKQFHHLLKIVPSNGIVITPKHDETVQSLFPHHPLIKIKTFGDDGDWQGIPKKVDHSSFDLMINGVSHGEVNWDLLGNHNMNNAVAAIASAHHIGVSIDKAIEALNKFRGVRRRLELRGSVRDIKVYDDFAHHPTAIQTTIAALRSQVNQDRIFAVLEFGSNTMRAGFHEQTIINAFSEADRVVLLKPTNSEWNLAHLLPRFSQPVQLFDSVTEIIDYLADHCTSGDHILCMSNQHFDGIHQRLLAQLAQ